MTVTLRGSSWKHVRGHDPLVAASAAFPRDRGVDVEWIPRTLTEFGVMDIGELARRFDLVVIDHPHVGTVAQLGSLVPLDTVLPGHVLDELGASSPGRSHQSYEIDGHQWALAIDAACQVSAYRPGTERCTTWRAVVSAAERGDVLWPLNPVDAQASLLTVYAQSGHGAGAVSDDFLDVDGVVDAFEMIGEVRRHLDRRCLGMNAIDVLDELTEPGTRENYCPLVFGYTNYSRHGFRPGLLRFGDVPRSSEGGRGRALLGGVGLGVSASSAHVDEAVRMAAWIADATVQSTVYVEAGGQPAHGQAWSDPHADAVAGGFFSDVRTAMDESWMRPRFGGYVRWQNESMEMIHEVVRGEAAARPAAVELNRLARRLFAEAGPQA